MTSGVPVSGSSITVQRRPNTCSTSSAVTISARFALRHDLPVAHGDQVGRVAAAWLRSCRTATSVVPARGAGRRAVPSGRSGARCRGRWSVRRAAGSAVCWASPSPATPAAAARRRARRRGGREFGDARSRPSPRRSPLVGAAPLPDALWCGNRPRATRSATVMPSGAIETAAAGRACARPPWSGSERISLPSRSTVPEVGVSSPGQAAQQGRLAAGVGADDDRERVVAGCRRPAVDD